MKEHYEEIQEFIRRLQNQLREFDNLKLVTDTYFREKGQFHMLDAILVNNDEALAIFEFKAFNKILKDKDFLEVFVPPNVSIKFIVISNGISHKVLNRNSNEINEFESPSKLLFFLTKLPSQAKIREIKQKIAIEIENQITEFFEDFQYEDHYLYEIRNNVKSYFRKEKVLEHIQFDKNGQFFHLSRDIRKMRNFENSFFQMIIQEVSQGELLYRYTTLDTLFATINHRTIRLNGLAGMNDKSEIKYVEEIIDEDFEPYKTLKDIEELNRRFILCSSTLPDDLMQWRLYGDDCKGACMVFEYAKTKNIPGLQVRKINYGINKNGENYHPELELLSYIINGIKNNVEESFQFRALTIWKHFFKSYEYAPEQEVRLLIITSKNDSIKGEILNGDEIHSLKKEWNLTYTHKIANPYITIEIDDSDLPLKFNEIILGSKCPEISINKNQFKQFLRDKKLLGVQIRESKINNYR